MKTYSTQPKAGEAKEPVSCPVCRDVRARTLWNLETYSFQKCRTCGHIYQNPRPRPGDLINRYDGDYHSYEVENAANFLNLMKLGLQDLDFGSLESALPSAKKFLDVGCATGALVEHLENRGWQAAGVEVCEGAAEWGRRTRGADIRTGTLDQAAFAPGTFDLVHSSHVIEHVPEPDQFLREIRRVLKPGGKLILVTPNTASLQCRVFGRNWRSVIPDHVHLFSRRGLRSLLEAQGFRILREKTWGGWALGARPAWVKPFLDRGAKKWGFGDVAALLAEKV